MTLTISQSEEEVLEPPVSAVSLEENYWPFLSSVIGTALLALLSQLVVSISLALQWNVPVEIRRWAGFFPHLVFRANRVQFEGIVYWSMVLSAVFLAMFSLSSFVSGRRLQVKAGRQFAWLDIFLLGLIVQIRFYITGFDAGVTDLAWVLMVVGGVGFVVGFSVIHRTYKQSQPDGSWHPPQVAKSFG